MAMGGVPQRSALRGSTGRWRRETKAAAVVDPLLVQLPPKRLHNTPARPLTRSQSALRYRSLAFRPTK